MTTLILPLVLAFISFIASAAIVLRIVIPILPPGPLSRRVPPSEFGLPSFRSLSPADKCHLWLASLDIVALGIFVWQTVNEFTVGPTGPKLALDPASAIRLWIIVTLRQTCLLVVAGVTLLYVRMAQPLSFGKTQWMLWAPTALLAITSTSIAGVLSGTGMNTLFYGLTGYSATLAILSTAAFVYLVRTLTNIKKNLTTLNEPTDTWPPMTQVEDKPRPSFATEDIDAIRDNASWISSTVGSRRNSVSAWSFSTHHTASQHGHGRPQTANHPSVPAKSSFWFGSNGPDDVHIPPVPPLPSPYGSTPPTSAAFTDSDPFRRDLPPLPSPRPRHGSQTSWLTSSAGTHTTMTAWSFPQTQDDNRIYEESNASHVDLHAGLKPYSRPVTPALADAQVLGGYGYSHSGSERGLRQQYGSADTLEISWLPALGWSITIWSPLAFVLPYLVFLAQDVPMSTPIYVLYVLSVTVSAPLLGLNLLCNCPVPIPVGLFDNHGTRSAPTPAPFIAGSLPPAKWSHEYKNSSSASVTVVEGRRSGDVWLSKGDAVGGKGKFGRAVTMLHAKPKLSVLPPEEVDDEELQPPTIIPGGEDSLPVNVHGTPGSDHSVQFGRLRGSNNGTQATKLSNLEGSLGFSSKIMVAEKHYSAMAQTIMVPGSTDPSEPGTATTLISTGTENKRASRTSHLRTRSVTSSINRPSTPTERDMMCPTPPPSFPLPPTPPNVRAARLAALSHKKSFSSGVSLNIIDDINEIDAMTAGVLPILVPGLKVGDDMRIKDDISPPGTYSKSKGRKAAKQLAEFGGDHVPAEAHTTHAKARQPRGRKQSHKRNHFSLPSLSLGKDGIQALTKWGSDAQGNKATQYMAVPEQVDDGRRNTVAITETVTTTTTTTNVHIVDEDHVYDRPDTQLGRTQSTRSFGLRADVPHNVDTARSSIVSNVPASAASDITLFEDFEAGLQSGPQAESTPHQSTLNQRPKSRHSPPPLPIQTNKGERRRSTIRYIKSDEDENSSFSYPLVDPIHETKTTSTFSQWTARAVRPLVPKRGSLTRKDSDKAPGLRPLTLLQDRANIANNNASESTAPTATTKPLTIGKRQKQRNHGLMYQQPHQQDENSIPNGGSPRANKNIKQLTLARSDTTRQRAVLRQTEVLPAVVIRPPSTSEGQAYAYDFQDD